MGRNRVDQGRIAWNARKYEREGNMRRPHQRTHPVKATGGADLYAATAGAVAFRQFQGNNSPRRLAG